MPVTNTGRGIDTGTNVENKDRGFQTAFLNLSAQAGLTATPGGPQVGAISISTYNMNHFAVVATAGDSCLLGRSDVSSGGHLRVVINGGANALAVFPRPGDMINALAVNAAFSVPAGKVAIFYCPAPGIWFALLSA